MQQALDYSSLIHDIDSNSLRLQFEKMEEMYQSFRNYCSVWTKHESWWCLDHHMIFAKLGEHKEQWIKELLEIRSEKQLFSSTRLESQLLGVKLDVGACQDKIFAKSRQIENLYVQQFALKTKEWLRDWLLKSNNLRERTENLFKCSKITSSITDMFDLQSLPASIGDTEEDLVLIRTCCSILMKYGDDIAPTLDVAESEFESLGIIFRRKSEKKDNMLEEVRGALKTLKTETESRLASFVLDWKKGRPDATMESPEGAIEKLRKFRKRLDSIKGDIELLRNGKEIAGEFYQVPDATNLDADLTNVLEVWTLMSNIWYEFESLEQLNWKSTASETVESRITTLLSKTNNLPVYVQQYEVYSLYIDKLTVAQDLSKQCLVLKSDSIRPRHWYKITQILGLAIPLDEITLGYLWKAVSAKSLGHVHSIVQVAEGEMSIERYLESIDEFIATFPVKVVKFQKSMLVENCTEISSKTQEFLQGLAALRNSCHYSAFEKHVHEKELELQSLVEISSLLETAQTQWVYMNGVFSTNKGIKTMLPGETLRFTEVEKALLQTLAKVGRCVHLQDLRLIPQLAINVTKAIDIFSTIKHSLGSFLEYQRRLYSRFYFLGDDDLLAFLGSKCCNGLSSSLKKMFTGIGDMILNGDGTMAGVISKEGERLEFKTILQTNCEPHDWLQAMESSIKTTIFGLVKDCVQKPVFDYLAIPGDLLVKEWIQKMPSQVINLSLRILWSLAMAEGMKTDNLNLIHSSISRYLTIMSQLHLTELDIINGKKRGNVIKELLYQRDFVSKLMESNKEGKEFEWSRCLTVQLVENSITVMISGIEFDYSFEYLGVQDQLVRTPLTDRCFDTLALALDGGWGGSPFGPAGTGKVILISK